MTPKGYRIEKENIEVKVRSHGLGNRYTQFLTDRTEIRVETVDILRLSRARGNSDQRAIRNYGTTAKGIRGGLGPDLDLRRDFGSDGSPR
jgi:hypothetical protein